MGKDKGHCPIRTCIVCRRKMPKTELDRIVSDPEGHPVLDAAKRALGRGAYICGNPVCREILEKRGGRKKGLMRTSSGERLPRRSRR